MDFGREYMGSESWVPATPAKPNSLTQQLMNHPGTTEWWKIPANETEFPSWQTGELASSHEYGGSTRMCEGLAMDDHRWSNVSFGNLLAMVGGPGDAATGQIFGATQSVNQHYGMSFISSCLANQRSSLDGPSSEGHLDSTPQFSAGGVSRSCSRPLFDLNVAYQTITESVEITNKMPHFEPLTPERTSKMAQRLDTTPISGNGELNPIKETQESNIACYQLGVKEKENMHHLCAVSSIQLVENHKPDNEESTEEAPFSKTPQTKPRKKKHRPKVVVEGQTRKTPKSDSKQPSISAETTRVKRKYVRKKVHQNPNTPLVEDNKTVANKEFPCSGAPTPKRKYVRKKGIGQSKTAILNEETYNTTEIMITQNKSSCKKSLNFDFEGQGQDGKFSYSTTYHNEIPLQAESFDTKNHLNAAVQLGQGIVGMGENGMNNPYEHPCCSNQVSNICMSMSERHNPSSSPHNKTDQSVSTRGKCHIVFSNVTHSEEENFIQTAVSPFQWTPKSLERLCGGINSQQVPTRIKAGVWSRNVRDTSNNSLQSYSSIFSQNSNENDNTLGIIPVICKKMRTDTGCKTAASLLQPAMNSIRNNEKLATHGYSSVALRTATNPIIDNPATINSRDGHKKSGLIASEPSAMMKKRRSRGHIRVWDSDTQSEIYEVKTYFPSESAAVSQSDHGFEILTHTPCIEALGVDDSRVVPTKKRSKRRITAKATQNHKQCAMKRIAQPLDLNWRHESLFDAVTEKLNQLDLNAESSQLTVQEPIEFMTNHMCYVEQHAIVPYQKGGAIVPYDSSFDRVRKRRPRPKVELDDETTRVWKLLLENINNEDIVGTDEEKAKWWEEERSVFNGRVDSFIARMHLVQGDRRFSLWKGSVLDSVVGVFLTQNVSDHLSSSAFMSLAARFPLNSGLHGVSYIESTRLSERMKPKLQESVISVLYPDEISGLSEEILIQQMSHEDSKIPNGFDYRKMSGLGRHTHSENSSDVVIAEDNLQELADISKHGLDMPQSSVKNSLLDAVGQTIDVDDFLSSQTSTISSENSSDSPQSQTTEITGSSSMRTAEEEPVVPNRINGHISFVKLLQMAESVLHGYYDESTSISALCGQTEPLTLSFDMHKEVQCEDLISPAKSTISCSESIFNTTPTSGIQSLDCFDLSQAGCKLSDTITGQQLSGAEVSEMQKFESTVHGTFQTPSSVEEMPGFSSSAQSRNIDQIEIHRMIENRNGQVETQAMFQMKDEKMKVSTSSLYLQKVVSSIDSGSKAKNSRNFEAREINRNSSVHEYHSSIKNNGSKPRGKTGKGKQEPIDWDSLRKQAQAGGRKRDKTPNTMDSVDWDAVRCSDVNDIAHTIRERGMNNMLAERIKDFLNRIVREHESLDLEWLRDVPPDKAKEYLLSFRGLGLKSVECVRLLTLHHLAFPVDTNVGRIAVRLGWVPLQPLPESLQLHLLEMYPVLESIQKYLWPRLCKLDQRTLYELHYQMITFGKVFCTKSKPNCNACPMRAECRHFASAFASARLALPAPKEKSIISTTLYNQAYQNQLKNVASLQLLPAPQTGHLDPKDEDCCLPLIEEPLTPEPVIEEPATPEPNSSQIQECDIEDISYEDHDEIPMIQLNMKEFTHNLRKIIHQNDEIHGGDVSKAIVTLTPEMTLIPTPKLKNVSQLRTEHQVYELPDSHPLLEGMDKREEDDPCPYLLAIWAPGETVNSVEAPKRQCGSQEPEKLCNDETCLSCNSIRETKSLTVRGTLLIPCRTAMRGSFPLNGTYFQVNEVFSDHESSLHPVDIPREWLWNLSRRIVYFGTSIPSIFKGLSTEGIQYCFWRGFVCVRGFDRKTRAPRPLIARLHFPASKLGKAKRNTSES